MDHHRIVAGALLLSLASVAAPAGAAETSVQWWAGISQSELSHATVVRIQRGVHTSDLAGLRDDQSIETPSGKRITVKRFRAIRALLAEARTARAVPRAPAFAVLPAPKTAGQPIPPGETASHLLARPPSDVVRLPSGQSVTVAQLRAMAPWVERRYGVSLSGAPQRRLAGPATRITTAAQLKTVPKNAPDSTILEAPNGRRVTLGQLRSVLRANRASRPGTVR